MSDVIDDRGLPTAMLSLLETARMTPRTASAWILRHGFSWSWGQIAAAHGTTRRTARVDVARALRILAE